MEIHLLRKQQALDLIDLLQKQRRPIHGLEIFRNSGGLWESSLYKTAWFSSQRGVYQRARTFIRHQMAGEWEVVEFKLGELRPTG